MSCTFATQKNSGGAFFKPGDHSADLALMIEPKNVLENQRNEYQGDVTFRDVVVADITVFRNSQNIETQSPFEVIRDGKIDKTALVSEAREHVGTGVPMLVTVGKKPGKNYYVFNFDVPADRVTAVAGYYTNREAALAEATANAPSFD
ncbi:hypothetical protein OG474_29930 [Kribbella sp. NBC_01505]|uniref:hypothetical protein n=1 Tax=Kribbella sp. NBC_01505 TaxID=2903580 RepID=UPI0038701432